MGYSGSSYMDVPMNQKIFMAQYECIKKLAEQESCIIVGRCADYALKDMPGLVSVFISADMDFKIISGNLLFSDYDSISATATSGGLTVATVIQKQVFDATTFSADKKSCMFLLLLFLK